ncbi:MAG: DUF503 domain-containing protein [Firmicutes bacterium]|jgi:uncharacterized protein YlxP (DUF503 family)|nr:DUF503 domain-containing protein [Bacillota bacterium]HPU01038.1 DUF503 domain-containing protein [Bacillota bacterium]
MAFRVAVCLLEIHIPQAASLKRKRQVIQSLVKRLRNRFNISMAEVGCQDLWQRSELAVAAICQNSGSADRVMEQVLSFIEHEGSVEIISSKVELY